MSIVYTQAELDVALRDASPDEWVVCVGGGFFGVGGSSKVTACDSTSVAAYENSQVRAFGSSQVKAFDRSQVTALGPSQVTADAYVAVTRRSPNATVEGGVLIEAPRIDSPEAWLEFHGVEVEYGCVVLFKAVEDEFRSVSRNDRAYTSYRPGTRVVADDFDPAPGDCGAGLHACSLPVRALHYRPTAARFVAIKVKVADLGHPDPDGDTGKIRFRAGTVLYECDIWGNEVKR